MKDKQFTNGMIVFVTALLLSGLSSFVGRFSIVYEATNLAQGFLDGLSVVACAVAIALLVRSQRAA